MKYVLFLFAIGCVSEGLAAVWDYGPSTGTFAGSAFNQNGFQTFADRVKFNADTLVSGLNYFTDSSSLDGTSLHIALSADNSGSPGSLLAQWDQNYDVFAFAGTFGGTDIYEATLFFDPVLFTGDITYWIGASGNGFDAHQALVSGPGDGVIAIFSGTGFIGFGPIGDQMFQLSGEQVPEPGSVLLGATGFLALLSMILFRSDVLGKHVFGALPGRVYDMLRRCGESRPSTLPQRKETLPNERQADVYIAAAMFQPARPAGAPGRAAVHQRWPAHAAGQLS